MKKHNLALAISIILSMTACGGRDNNSNAPIDSTPSETNHTQGGQTTNDTQNSSDDEQKTDDKQSAGKKTTAATGSTGSATAGNGGNATGNNNSSLPPVLQEEPKPTDDSKDLNEKQGVLLVAGDAANELNDTPFTINNLNAQLQEKGLLSNNKAAESKEITLKNNKKITATTVTDDTSPIVNNYRFYNQSMQYAKFGATSTHFTNKEDQSSAGIPPELKSFSTGAITKSFDDNLTNKEATYSGNAIVVAAKDNNEPQTLFADFSATVQFGVAKDFTGNINNFKKQNANGDLEEINNFNEIILNGSSSTTANKNEIKGENFVGKFYGENGIELSGTFSSQADDDQYGKYYGSFGGKRGDATAVSVPPVTPTTPPDNSPKFIDNYSENKSLVLFNQDYLIGNEVHYSEDEFATNLLKIQFPIEGNDNSSPEYYNLSGDVIKYSMDQTDGGYLANSYNKSYSYSQFGVHNSIAKPETVEEINKLGISDFNPYDALNESIDGRYSIGQVTTNFDDVITIKKAEYQGTALLSAKKESKLETYLADFSATVDFSSANNNYDAFTGTINNFRKEIDGQFTSAYNLPEITMNGAFVDNQKTIMPDLSNAVQFSGSFYGPNAAEVGGIFSGNNTELGKYEGSFGGKKQP